MGPVKQLETDGFRVQPSGSALPVGTLLRIRLLSWLGSCFYPMANSEIPWSAGERSEGRPAHPAAVEIIGDRVAARLLNRTIFSLSPKNTRAPARD
jgi:hypothetical protein